MSVDTAVDRFSHIDSECTSDVSDTYTLQSVELQTVLNNSSSCLQCDARDQRLITQSNLGSEIDISCEPSLLYAQPSCWFLESNYNQQALQCRSILRLESFVATHREHLLQGIFSPVHPGADNISPLCESTSTQSFGILADQNSNQFHSDTVLTNLDFSPKISKFKSKRIRRNVTKACGNCKIAKTKCGFERPCQRCLKTGRETSCADIKQKKRGPKQILFEKTRHVENCIHSCGVMGEEEVAILHT
jgi:energy-coupling factor transporter ATP-binding protein EcfA2